MSRSATFSPDRKRRFDLVRDWTPDGELRRLVNFIMLNPSKAGEEDDDPTVRKNVGFAKRWGYTAIALTNLSAIVATDPWDLPMWSGIDPDNAAAQRRWIQEASLIVAAWGSQPRALERNIAISELIYHVRNLASPAALWCIGENRKGAPLHPSRAAYTDAPVVWREGL